jgi:diadenosine tetraphosphatase ApaH/serine/threonine PP2A family protein phosphatase
MAIFSDVHANRQAWAAMERDIREAGVDTAICLGDIVGYGPEPQAVLDGVREFTSNIVIGNHDAVVGGRMSPSEFNPTARAVIEWTCGQVDQEGRKYLATVPEMILGEDLCLVHAESAVPMRFTYLFQPEDTFESFTQRPEKITFVGHTHHPTVFSLHQASGKIVQGEPVNMTLHPDYRYIVNVGSSGEPRDYDVRGSYVIYDSAKGTVEFRRVPFDIHAYCQDLENRKLAIEPHFLKVHKYMQGMEEWERARMHEAIPEETVLMQPVKQVAPSKSQPVKLAVGALAKGMTRKQRARRKRLIGRIIALVLFLVIVGGLAYAVYWVKDYVHSEPPTGSGSESTSP